MIILNLFLILLFSAVLVKSAEWVVVALRRIARKSKTGVFAISAVVLAIGTSLPELFIGITSAIEKTPSVALGVILGSNIANTALIAGIVAFIFGKITVHSDYVKKDVFLALLAGLLPLALIADGVLGRVDGLVLLSAYGAYASSFFKSRFQEIAHEHKKENFFYRFWTQINHIDFDITKEYGRLFVGIALLLFSGEMIVKNAQSLALYMEIPIFVVGVVILAIGATLPELTFSLRSIKSGQSPMFFGNLLGSIIANSTLIIGITSVISPIVISSMSDYIIAVITFIVVFLTFWYFIRSKNRLDRWEGGILVLLYMIFIVVEFML